MGQTTIPTMIRTNLHLLFPLLFASRQFQMNPTKPSFDMTILYSYRDECTLNTNQLYVAFVIKIL